VDNLGDKCLICNRELQDGGALPLLQWKTILLDILTASVNSQSSPMHLIGAASRNFSLTSHIHLSALDARTV
jgi:hypothetical protein